MGNEQALPLISKHTTNFQYNLVQFDEDTEIHMFVVWQGFDGGIKGEGFVGRETLPEGLVCNGKILLDIEGKSWWLS